MDILHYDSGIGSDDEVEDEVEVEDIVVQNLEDDDQLDHLPEPELA